jgi:hypothetical protein
MAKLDTQCPLSARVDALARPVFPPPPLKFRTSGFPQYGFKLESQTRSSPADSRLKLSTSIPPEARRLIRGWAQAPRPCGPHRACSAGPADKSGPVQRSFAPQWVMLSHRVTATMTSSETLRAFRRLIYFVLADLCPTALSGLVRRGSPICSACLFFRAAVRTPVSMATASGRFFVAITGLRLSASGSALTFPIADSQGSVTRLQRSLYATARKIARPPSARTFTTELSSRQVTPPRRRL